MTCSCRHDPGGKLKELCPEHTHAFSTYFEQKRKEWVEADRIRKSLEPENPQAFPHAVGTQDTWTAPGMTLRDYFAAKALPAIIRETVTLSEDLNDIVSGQARAVALAYHTADLMLTERAK